MVLSTRFSSAVVTAMAMIFGVALFSGCEDSGGGGGDDVGDNDKDLVICVGDSITQGFRCDGAPYPSQLAAMTGKTVRNMGITGARASVGASRISSQLGCKPGYVCILYGANDAIKQGGSSAPYVKEQIRAIIVACKDNKSIPILGTVTPMVRGHRLFDGGARAINIALRELAKEEGVKLVDLYNEFGEGEAYLGIDGLHPNAAGAELIAKCFAEKL